QPALPALPWDPRPLRRTHSDDPGAPLEAPARRSVRVSRLGREHRVVKPQAIVIGSGFGGLAAAVRLLARGYRVRVLEALDTPGGRARVFAKGDFQFDAGPTVITAPYLFDELFACLGKRREDYVEFLPVDPFYRCKFDDGESFDYVGDDERLLGEIERLSPKDVD